MKNLKIKHVKELDTELLKSINGGKGIPGPLGLGAILMGIDAVIAYMEGIEEAYYEKCG